MTKEQELIIAQIKCANFYLHSDMSGDLIHIFCQIQGDRSGYIIHEDGRTSIFIDVLGMYFVEPVDLEKMKKALRFKNFK